MIDGPCTAVLDHIVDGKTAVLLLEDDGEVIEQLDIDVERVPEAGRHEGALFEVELDAGEVVAFEYHPEREQNRRDRMQGKFDRLSKRLGDEE